ncbi:MAG: branched-chain amino acid ABC transporter substrate-binding protein [Chloroflexi bacterium]|nr:branched-chain amino acid ABC transporter substrate-binding protein [Chloroflexota bacterium]
MPQLPDRLRSALRRRSTYGYLGVAVVIVVALALASGGSDAEDPDTGLRDVDRGPEIEIVIAAGEPLLVGVSSALTGPIAVRGKQYRDAVVVAVDRWKAANGETIGGHAIVVVAEDDGCTESDVTRRAAGRHLQRPGLVGVLGPQCSTGAAAAIPIYNLAGVVSISGSATLSRLAENQPEPRFFFRTAYRNDAQGALVRVYVTAEAFLGADDAFVVDDNESYGIGLASDIIAQLQLAGVTVTRASVEQGAVNFSELARTIAEAAPDVLIYAGFNPEAGLLLRQARDAGYDGPFVGGDAICGGPECPFLVALGEQAEGAAFSGCSPPLDADFVEQFKVVHVDSVDDGAGTPTASFVAHYADATTILLDAVAAVAEVRGDSLVINPTRLRDAIASSSFEGGLSGNISFDANGDRVGTIPPLDPDAEPDPDAPDALGIISESFGLVPCFVENGTIAYFN